MKTLIKLLIAALCFCYFGYHFFFSLGGRSHLETLRSLHNQKEKELQDIENQEQALAKKIQALKPSTLDKDLAEERIRIMLSKGHTSEEVIVIEEEKE